ncbi:EamA family transporter RarD [Actinomyces slackii]|uniref:Putative chloramphenical resistance permease RarD n=1 Tax=Actinomyces slackii TaxID=52774 RepID=A0A3S4WI87_9ACTO|nr:EamA family transporter RarD [Actinomyces slackii]VEG75574.1 putative chloramphenical resistance permease RarD [Actinomyces slackii]
MPSSTGSHPASPSTADQASTSASGMALVVGCYVLWGFFPLYFRLLDAAGSVEIIGHRIIWAMVTCLLLIAVRRRWSAIRRLLTTPRLVLSASVSGVLVSVNWLVYVYGVNTGRTADAALGYFINPLVTVALAALVLGERLRPAHRASLALAAAGVGVLVVMQGSLPWISLALAFSFGLYGLVKKRVARQVDALTGLCAETLIVSPVALAYLGWLAAHGQAAVQGPQGSAWLGALLVLAGPVTAAPLLLFAAGTRRVPLSVVGLSQYFAPIIQFLLAWLVFHEEIPPARWAAMVLVWMAVAVFVADALRQLARTPGRSQRP